MATTKKSTQEEKDTKKKTTTAAKKTTAKTAAKKETTTKKATAAKATTTKKVASKATTTKKTATKPAAKSTAKTAKKTVTKKEPEEKKKVTQKKVTTEGFSVKGSNEIDDLLGALSITDQSEPTPAPTKPAKGTTKTTDKKAKEATKTTAKKPKPSEIKRPERKAKTFTKEEKVLYKRLEDAFTYVANLTMVMEERLLDKKVITDLTLGEIHVLEVVDKESTMPMTKIANELKITVGSLTTCVNRLVKKEYLLRERDQGDHRIMKISTTLKAKKVLKIHDRFHEDILYGILDGVTIRDATKVMTQVKRTLENYFDPKEKNYEKPIDKKKKKNI